MVPSLSCGQDAPRACDARGTGLPNRPRQTGEGAELPRTRIALPCGCRNGGLSPQDGEGVRERSLPDAAPRRQPRLGCRGDRPTPRGTRELPAWRRPWVRRSLAHGRAGASLNRRQATDFVRGGRFAVVEDDGVSRAHTLPLAAVKPLGTHDCFVAEALVSPDDVGLGKAIVRGGADGRFAESSRGLPAPAGCLRGGSAVGQGELPARLGGEAVCAGADLLDSNEGVPD